ncbi:hypothetical protein CCUG60885_01776 [Mycobacteroides salmoniphilum]|uniref:Uncharacterized protein n=2 Tax=Mycobacteroides TaxID=670516 RepID=A0A4R8SFU0_9MYCO|nr:hypothetical protein CCUG60885_01776 [Mycobacteroides salmoniphilum]TEA04738.1 hypothetical protein CCUG60883_02034 [Mycobacteroides salmoniphilum]
MSGDFHASDLRRFYKNCEATESSCVYTLNQLDRYESEGSRETICLGGNAVEATVDFEHRIVKLDLILAPADWEGTVLRISIEEFRALLNECLHHYRPSGDHHNPHRT